MRLDRPRSVWTAVLTLCLFMTVSSMASACLLCKLVDIGLISRAAFVPGEYKGMVTLAPSGGGPTQVFRVEGNVTQELDRVVVAVQLFDHPRLLSVRAEIGDDLGTRIEIVDAKGHLRRNEM